MKRGPYLAHEVRRKLWGSDVTLPIGYWLRRGAEIGRSLVQSSRFRTTWIERRGPAS